MRTAFTLIELLVVIAIIAVLAAILFPVFSQAKEAAKKAVTLSNIKQLATGTVLYANDSDDTFPLATSPIQSTGAQRWDFQVSVPNGWRPGSFSVEPRLSEDGMVALNSTQPYVKSYGILKLEGIAETTPSASIVPKKPRASVGFSYNGMLHAWSTTAIERPSQNVLFWPGRGKTNVVGLTLTNPVLRCDSTGPCLFNPSDLPQAGSSGGPSKKQGFAWFADKSIWVYGKGMHFVHSDTSASFVVFASASGEGNIINDIKKNPFGDVDANGIPLSIWTCRVNPDAVGYPCLFRPDYAFE